jgi:putative ABC transport system substrate-binding protein
LGEEVLKFLCVLALLLPFLSVNKAFATDKDSSVVMLTWRGKTNAETAFLKALETSGRNINVIHFDAGRDRRALGAFLHSNKDTIRSADVVYTFGTLTARVVQSFDLKGVPHVFNIVADPVGTELVESLEYPGADRTGAKNTVPLGAVFNTLNKAIEFETVAALFDPREVTSEAQVTKLAAVLGELGKTVKGVRFVPDAGNLSNQIETMRSELSKADLIYIPAVSSFVGQTRLISEASPEDAVIVGAIEAYVGNGATIAIATDYFERGRAAAEIVFAILDGATPASIPVREVAIEEAIIVIDSKDARATKIDLDSLAGILKMID